MDIREATVEDIPLIHRLAWQVFPETYKEILSGEQLRYMMEWMYSEENLLKQMTSEGHTYLLAYQDGEPVGYVSFQMHEDNTWHLQKIYVLPQRQGEHLGRQLFDAAVAAIRAQTPGPFRLELNVNRNNPAIGFYKHLGMRVLRQGDFPIGGGFYMNDYIMAIDIPGINAELTQFIEKEIIPRYAAFDKAHREDHAKIVIERALELAQHYPVKKEIVYAAAACHDLGLAIDRKTHHLESGRIIREMPQLRKWFSPEEIELIAQAAEDHRASSDHEPRSIYGRIVAEADRLIVPETIIRRTIQFGLSHYPELDKKGHWERTLEHLHEKYYYGGYLKLWIPESPNVAALEELRAIIGDEPQLRTIFERMYAEEIV